MRKYRDPSYGKAGFIFSSIFKCDEDVKQLGPAYWAKHWKDRNKNWDGTFDLKISLAGHAPESFPPAVQKHIRLDINRDPIWGQLDYLVVPNVPLPKVPTGKRVKTVAVRWTGTRYDVVVGLTRELTLEARRHYINEAIKSRGRKSNEKPLD